MYLGTQEIRANVKGTFQKFYYVCTINRNKHTEHFKCFEGTDKTQHISNSVFFTRNLESAKDVIEGWNRTYNDNSFVYRLLLSDAVKNPFLTVDEVIREYQSIFKGRVIGLIEYNHREIIH